MNITVKAIWFDMDGTIANLYEVEGWLADLEAERTRPYEEAVPLLNMNSLARILNRLHREGWEINIVSWTSKNGTDEYNARVAEVKRAWLRKHLKSVEFTTIDIIPYGTRKGNNRYGILFDDEERNRNDWTEVAYDVTDILGVLKTIA